MPKGTYKNLFSYAMSSSSWEKVIFSLKKNGVRDTLLLARNKLRGSSVWDYSKSIRELSQMKRSPGVTKHGKLKFSVLLPVYKVKEKYLMAAFNSVLMQTYGNWELCICHDNPTDTGQWDLIKGFCDRDDRVKAVQSEGSVGISNATNLAATLATGDYVTFLDHDDELDVDALLLISNELERVPYDIIYTDEDKMDGNGNRSDPFFKPDWSKDLLYSHNYITHMCFYRRDIVEELGYLRSKYDGAQDYDLILRATELTENIGHLRYIAYHWRMIGGSVALNSEAKPYAYENGRRALQEAIVNENAAAIVSHGQIDGYYQIEYSLGNANPFVSIIIATRDRMDLLYQCIRSIRHATGYDNYEIIVVDNNSTDAATKNYLEYLSRHGVVVVEDHGHFNHSRLNNKGASVAKGEVLLFLNNDIEAVNTEWLRELVSHTVRPGVGCVGAKLLYPSGTIQHAGVCLGLGGGAAHPHRGFPANSPGYFGALISVKNYLAVTGACLSVRRDIYDLVQGFDEVKFPISYNDVDFCLKIHKAGYRNLVTPHAVLIHYESASRDGRVNSWELEMLRATWGKYLKGDPFYSPYLTKDAETMAYSHEQARLFLVDRYKILWADPDEGDETVSNALARFNAEDEELLTMILKIRKIYYSRADLQTQMNVSRLGSLIPLLLWYKQAQLTGELFADSDADQSILSGLLRTLHANRALDKEIVQCFTTRGVRRIRHSQPV